MNTTDLHIPSNRVRDIQRYIVTELAGLYPKGELHVFSTMLFEAFLGWSLPQLLIHHNDTINQSDLLRFHWAVEDLKKYRPIQHIIGYAEFCGNRIKVTPDVLIPRPETEEIVNRAYYHLHYPLHILDLCTGSGCIAVSLAKMFPMAKVFAVDISASALEIANENARQNGVSIHTIQCDILHDEPALPIKKFDVIISNPPYVMEKEKAEMQANVLDYDPHLALFVPDDDPLLFYRAIGRYASQHLLRRGELILEINEHLGDETCQLLKEMGFKTTLHQDFRDKDRSINAHLS